jgi:hypothetical protein
MTCVKPAKLSRRVTKSQQKKIKKLFFFFLFLKYGTSFYFSSTEHHFIFCEVRNTEQRVQKQNFSGKRRSDGADPQTAGTKLLGQHTPDPEKTHQKFTTTLSSDVGHTDTNTNPHLFHHLIHDGLKTQKVITDRADPQTLGTNILGLQSFRPRKHKKVTRNFPGSGARFHLVLATHSELKIETLN